MLRKLLVFSFSYSFAADYIAGSGCWLCCVACAALSLSEVSCLGRSLARSLTPSVRPSIARRRQKPTKVDPILFRPCHQTLNGQTDGRPDEREAGSRQTGDGLRVTYGGRRHADRRVRKWIKLLLNLAARRFPMVVLDSLPLCVKHPS